MTMTRTADAIPESVVQRAAALIKALGRVPESLFQTLFRVSVASVFWASGLTKIASWQTTIVLFRDAYKVSVLPLSLDALVQRFFLGGRP